MLELLHATHYSTTGMPDWNTCYVLQELLNSNMQQNLQLVVQVAKEYTEQLTAKKIIELLENSKTYHGLYFYLGSYIAFSEDPEVHFK